LKSKRAPEELAIEKAKARPSTQRNRGNRGQKVKKAGAKAKTKPNPKAKTKHEERPECIGGKPKENQAERKIN